MASLLLTRGPARPIMRRLAPSRTSSRVPVVCFVNGGSKAKIKFRIPKKVAFGQSVALVGGTSELGSWDPTASINLEWHDGHEWSAEAELPVGVELEYKYIVIDGKGRALEWQPGSNMRLAVPEGSNALLEVVDSWTGAAHEVQLGGDAAAAAEPATSGEETLVNGFDEEVAPAFAAAVPLAADGGNGTPAAALADLEETASSSGEESPGGVPVGAALVTQPLEEMTVKQLKLLAKEYGVSGSGRKMDIIDRIKDAMGMAD